MKIITLPAGAPLCCCGPVTEPETGPCRIPPDIEETLALSVSSSNTVLQVTGQMVWTDDEGGKWIWEDFERCCLDSDLSSWCGYSLTLFCNHTDHPLYDSNFPIDAYVLIVSSSMFDPAQNGGSVAIRVQPSSVLFNPLRITGSFDAVLYNGDCGGESSGVFTIEE